MLPRAKQMPNAIISAHTTVGPTGVESRIEDIIPMQAHTTEIIAEQMTTPLKLLHTLMDERAGNITSAEISSEPTRLMARTIITAMTTATRRL